MSIRSHCPCSFILSHISFATSPGSWDGVGGTLSNQRENTPRREAHSLPGPPGRDLTRTQGVWLPISPSAFSASPVPPPAHSIPPFWSELAVVGDLQVSPPFLPWVRTLPSHTHPACPLFPQPGNPALAPGPHPLECPPSSVLSSSPPHTLAASLSLPQVGPPIESRNPSAASASQALSLGPCGFLT